MKDSKVNSRRLLSDLVKICTGGGTLIEPGTFPFKFADEIPRKYFFEKEDAKKPPFNELCIDRLNCLIRYAFCLIDSQDVFDESIANEKCRKVVKCLNTTLKTNHEDLGPSNDSCWMRAWRVSVADYVSSIISALKGIETIGQGELIRQLSESSLPLLQQDPSTALQQEQRNKSSIMDFDTDSGVDMLKVIIVGDRGEVIFQDADFEQNVWKKLSKVYCTGVPIDKLISHGLETDSFYRWDTIGESFMRYYLAKFNLKRGLIEPSNKNLEMVTSSISSIEPDVAKRLGSLARARIVTNKAAPSKEQFEEFARVFNDIENLSSVAKGEYIAYECASALGAQVTNMLRNFGAVDAKAISRMRKAISQRERIVKQYNAQLGNQEVVTISLRWFLILAQMKNESGILRIDELKAIAYSGLEACRRRKNSLFHIQCVLVLLICSILEQDRRITEALTALSYNLIQEFNINRTQEGVLQLLSYIYEIDREIFDELCSPRGGAHQHSFLSKTLRRSEIETLCKHYGSYRDIYEIDLLAKLDELGFFE